MSGSRFHYTQHQLTQILRDIVDDSEAQRRWPNLTKELTRLEPVLYKIIKDMDWDLSGDTQITDDKKFEKESILKLNNLA